ncbi:MAG: extracellular solute-binding protein [Candidatus Paceibacterota bacterium]
MPKSSSKFQIIVLAVFIIAIIAGVAAFALYKGKSNTSTIPAVTIWGTFPAEAIQSYVSDINASRADKITVYYSEFSPVNFNTKFINSLASGSGPDAILLPADMILTEQGKLTVIPYSVLSQRDFMNNYIQEASVYLTSSGIRAIPFTIDPLVTYWNRDTFNSSGLALAPSFWDEFTGSNLKPGLPQKLTIKDQNGNIRKSAVAMGDFSNMTNAREVLGSLFLQNGNPVTMTTQRGVESALANDNAAGSSAALRFFSQFADPTSANYSWNRSLPVDKIAFLSGQLATYFGFASEIADLRSKNPNLNFDVAPFPQIRGGEKVSYGELYGFSLVRNSSLANAAYQVIEVLTDPVNLAGLASKMYLPTVRNDLIAQGSTDPYVTIFNQAALISRTWLDSSQSDSRSVFGNLVRSIVSGQKSLNDAITSSNNEYNQLLLFAGQ